MLLPQIGIVHDKNTTLRFTTALVMGHAVLYKGMHMLSTPAPVVEHADSLAI